MTISELKSKLEQLGTPITWYYLEKNGDEDQSLTIKNENAKWIVYYSERGGRFEVSEYETESQACKDLLKRVYDRFDFMKKFLNK